MKISTSTWLKFWLLCLTAYLRPLAGNAQTDSMNMDAVYARPFLMDQDKMVALGGYLEANSRYASADGVSEGLSFQARRLTLFMAASIHKHIKFLSEFEFEGGTREIAIEFAAMDVSLHPALNLRGGIVMNPIGGFNQNHDGPRWEFIERPDVSVNLLPATWSNVGFGAYGKAYRQQWVLGYECYLTNGFDASITDNSNGITYLPAAKENKNRFEESSNGKALVTGKLAAKHRRFGEIGFSYMGGIYNNYRASGLTLDNKLRVDVLALDLNTGIKRTNTRLVGEVVVARIETADDYTQQYGNNQVGFFLDIVQPLIRRSIFDWEKAVVNLSLRTDYVDWNIGQFEEDKKEIGEELWAITPSISLRPSGQTIFRINYRYQWQWDILRNPAARTASWLMGFSTYF